MRRLRQRQLSLVRWVVIRVPTTGSMEARTLTQVQGESTMVPKWSSHGILRLGPAIPKPFSYPETIRSKVEIGVYSSAIVTSWAKFVFLMVFF